MTPDLERRAVALLLRWRIDRAERGIRECRSQAAWTRNLRWSREAADWQDIRDAAQARLDALEATRHGVTPEGTPQNLDSRVAITAESK